MPKESARKLSTPRVQFMSKRRGGREKVNNSRLMIDSRQLIFVVLSVTKHVLFPPTTQHKVYY